MSHSTYKMTTETLWEALTLYLVLRILFRD